MYAAYRSLHLCVSCYCCDIASLNKTGAKEAIIGRILSDNMPSFSWFSSLINLLAKISCQPFYLKATTNCVVPVKACERAGSPLRI